MHGSHRDDYTQQEWLWLDEWITERANGYPPRALPFDETPPLPPPRVPLFTMDEIN